MAKKEVQKGKWYQTGKDGIDRATQLDAAQQAKMDSKGPRRFWIDTDSAAKCTFLDTPSFFMHEHNLKIAGKYFNFFTCIKDIDTCPVCESGNNSSYVMVGTVISHKKFTDKDGKEHTNQKQLYVARGRARQKLVRQIEKRDGDLTFCVYEMARGTSQTEASVGEDMEFIKRLTRSQIEALIPEGEDETWLQPFNYEEILRPLPAADLRKIAGGIAPIGSTEETVKENEEDHESDEAPKSTEKQKKEKGSEKKPSSIDDLL